MSASPWATSTMTGCWDLVVGAGQGHAPEVVAYSGKAADGKGPFATELARFAAFAPDARGGISVTASQIDGFTTADNIIVGSASRGAERGQSVQLEAACRRTRRPLCSRA